jgi:hypothetical protein
MRTNRNQLRDHLGTWTHTTTHHDTTQPPTWCPPDTTETTPFTDRDHPDRNRRTGITYRHTIEPGDDLAASNAVIPVHIESDTHHVIHDGIPAIAHEPARITIGPGWFGITPLQALDLAHDLLEAVRVAAGPGAIPRYVTARDLDERGYAPPPGHDDATESCDHKADSTLVINQGVERCDKCGVQVQRGVRGDDLALIPIERGTSDDVTGMAWSNTADRYVPIGPDDREADAAVRAGIALATPAPSDVGTWATPTPLDMPGDSHTTDPADFPQPADDDAATRDL